MPLYGEKNTGSGMKLFLMDHFWFCFWRMFFSFIKPKNNGHNGRTVLEQPINQTFVHSIGQALASHPITNNTTATSNHYSTATTTRSFFLKKNKLFRCMLVMKHLSANILVSLAGDVFVANVWLLFRMQMVQILPVLNGVTGCHHRLYIVLFQYRRLIVQTLVPVFLLGFTLAPNGSNSSFFFISTRQFLVDD